jgi:kynureninase
VEVDERTAAVLVSAVLFETSRIVPRLDGVGAACRYQGAELLVDAYHALGVVPFSMRGLEDAWITGGGYKYLQLGEGNCFLRLPPHAQGLRPVVTGWFAEFEDLTSKATGLVGYASGGDRFAGSTYDPTSHYRAAAVLDFFASHGLTPSFLREVSLHQNGLLATLFDDLDADPDVITRDRSAPREAFGGFLALTAPNAGELQKKLAERGVLTDSRGDKLRFGPAPYLSDSQLEAAIATLGEVLR